MAVLKPLSYKDSLSLSVGEGTSISDSTYLVAQIARFTVTLNEYQTCKVVRLNTPAVDKIIHSQSLVSASDIERAIANPHLSDEEKRAEILRFQKLQLTLYQGMMVCDDKIQKTPKQVDESYFYFTQHFTEGDMLDQADLYNHPWLLPLRGVRDFAVFMDAIKGSEVANWANYFDRTDQDRDAAWALSELDENYRKRTPSFPGFYTVLGSDETVSQWPFPEKRFSKKDQDINGELTCRWKEDSAETTGCNSDNPKRQIPGEAILRPLFKDPGFAIESLNVQ